MFQKSTFFGRFIFFILLSCCLSAFLASTLSQNISFLPLQADGDGFFFLCGAGLCQPLPPCINTFVLSENIYSSDVYTARCSCCIRVLTQQAALLRRLEVRLGNLLATVQGSNAELTATESQQLLTVLSDYARLVCRHDTLQLSDSRYNFLCYCWDCSVHV